jgi:hypothetical protein
MAEQIIDQTILTLELTQKRSNIKLLLSFLKLMSRWQPLTLQR